MQCQTSLGSLRAVGNCARSPCCEGCGWGRVSHLQPKVVVSDSVCHPRAKTGQLWRRHTDTHSHAARCAVLCFYWGRRCGSGFKRCVCASTFSFNALNQQWILQENTHVHAKLYRYKKHAPPICRWALFALLSAPSLPWHSKTGTVTCL